MNKIILFLGFLLLFCFGSCRTVRMQHVPVPVRHDSIVYQNRIDSIFIQKTDSVRIVNKGDTVYFESWRTLFKDRIKTDTLIVKQYEEKPFPVKIPVEVEKKLNWWQRMTGAVGTFTLLALAVFIFIGIRNFFK